MKKIFIKLLLLSSIFIFTLTVNAASGSLSVSKTSVENGSTFAVTVNLNGVAAWNVHVNSEGPVTGCTIAQADATSDALNANKSFKATCTTTGEGTVTVTLTGDATSEDGNTINLSGSKTVTVVAKTEKPVDNTTTNTNTTTDKSTNNNLSSLTIDGYTVNKEDDNNYTLTVDFEADSINIKAVPEFSKSTITGTGLHQLEVGENIIEIKVTSESGAEKIIYVKVTRKPKTEETIPTPIETNTQDKENQSSFNIITHLIALIIGIGIGFGLSFVIKNIKKVHS